MLIFPLTKYANYIFILLKLFVNIINICIWKYILSVISLKPPVVENHSDLYSEHLDVFETSAGALNMLDKNKTMKNNCST